MKNVWLGLSSLMILAGCSFNAFQSGAGYSPNSHPVIAAGNVAGLPGQGSTSVPTANGVVARIQNGLQGNVSSLKGNFALSLAQVKGNLPKSADPTLATGFDQVQLLAYAACSDLTTNSPPKMQSIYNVAPGVTVAPAIRTALVAAGVKMLDQYVANLASHGPTSSEVTTAFNNLVTQVSSNNSTIAFMSVCIAANTAGTTLMSF